MTNSTALFTVAQELRKSPYELSSKHVQQTLNAAVLVRDNPESLEIILGHFPDVSKVLEVLSKETRQDALAAIRKLRGKL